MTTSGTAEARPSASTRRTSARQGKRQKAALPPDGARGLGFKRFTLFFTWQELSPTGLTLAIQLLITDIKH